MSRLLVALGLLAGCGAAHHPTVERGGETAQGEAQTSVETRIDALLERLDHGVEAMDAAAYAELSDEPGRAAVARLVLAARPFVAGGSSESSESSEGAPTGASADAARNLERLAFVAGALFGAHVEPLVAAPVTSIGAAILRRTGASEDRVEWLYPHAGPTPAPEVSDRALSEGLARQVEGSLAALEAADLGRCTRSTWLQQFRLDGALFDREWGSTVERIWVARLDCLAEVGLFLFTEHTDGTVRLLGSRFLSEEAHRDALAILESLNAEVAPEVHEDVTD